jgi:hypothetical protein
MRRLVRFTATPLVVVVVCLAAVTLNPVAAGIVAAVLVLWRFHPNHPGAT